MPLLLLALDPEAEPKDGTDQKRTGSATRGNMYLKNPTKFTLNGAI